MKKNLGKILVIFLSVFSLQLSASTYKWSAEIGKKTAYVDEAIYLKYVCKFSDKSELYTIDFNPITSNDMYSLKLLAESERIINNTRVNSYEFVAFAKKSGTIVFDFEMLMKKTTQDSIENTVLGRDNVEKEEFTLRAMRQKKLSVNVLESGSKTVGMFSLRVKKDTPSVQAYEPYHMEIMIDGIGNIQTIQAFEFSIEGVKVFSNKPSVDMVLTKDGYSGSWSQKFAFVSDTNFTLPDVEFSYFDLNEKILKNIRIESQEIKVVKGFVKEELLDTKEKGFEFSYEYLYYLLTFMAGFLLAKVKIKKVTPKVTKDEVFMQKILNAQSLGEIAIILTFQDSQKYKELILQIENKESKSLAKLKKELLD